MAIRANTIEGTIKITGADVAERALSGFGRAFDKAADTAEKSAGRFSKISTQITKAMSGLGKIALTGAAAGITALGAGMAGAGLSGLRFNSSMEIVTAQLNAFTKDGEATAGILDMIRERAAKTPFAFEEMAQATAGLYPVARSSGAALEDLVQQAEILAASNPAEGLEGAAFALREAVSGDFTSIIERFNLPRQYINKLKEEGVPALEIVGRAMTEMGYDASLVSNIAETMSGRWSTFTDTLQGLASTATAPLFDKLSEGLGTLQRKLEDNMPALEAFAAGIGEKLGEAFDWVVNTGIPSVITAWETLQTTIESFKTGDFSQLKIDLTTIFGEGGATVITDALQGIREGWGLARDALVTFKQALDGDWKNAEQIHPLHQAVGELGTVAREVFGWMTTTGLPMLRDSFNESLPANAQLLRDIAAAMREIQGDSQVTAGRVSEDMLLVRAATSETAPGVRSDLDLMFDPSAVPADWLNKASTNVREFGVQTHLTFWQAVDDAVYLKDRVSTNVGYMSTAVTNHVTNLKNAWIRDWNILSTNTGIGIENVKTHIGNLQIAWSRDWNTIKTSTGTAIDGVKGFFGNLATSASQKIDEAVGYFQALPGRISGAVGDLSGTLVAAGRQVIDGLLAGINEKWGAVKTRLSELTSMIPSWKGPPSRDKQLLYPTGQWIMEGLERGMVDHMPRIEAGLRAFTDDMAMAGWKAAGQQAGSKRRAHLMESVAGTAGLKAARDQLPDIYNDLEATHQRLLQHYYAGLIPADQLPEELAGLAGLKKARQALPKVMDDLAAAAAQKQGIYTKQYQQWLESLGNLPDAGTKQKIADAARSITDPIDAGLAELPKAAQKRFDETLAQMALFTKKYQQWVETLNLPGPSTKQKVGPPRAIEDIFADAEKSFADVFKPPSLDDMLAGIADQFAASPMQDELNRIAAGIGQSSMDSLLDGIRGGLDKGGDFGFSDPISNALIPPAGAVAQTLADRVTMPVDSALRQIHDSMALPAWQPVVDEQQTVWQTIGLVVHDEMDKARKHLVDVTAIMRGAIKGLMSSIDGLINKINSIPSIPDGGGGLNLNLGGARAAGGPVMAGVPYLVGERGPELFMPRMSGIVASHTQTRNMLQPAANSTTINGGLHIHLAPGTPQSMADELLDELRARGL